MQYNDNVFAVKVIRFPTVRYLAALFAAISLLFTPQEP